MGARISKAACRGKAKFEVKEASDGQFYFRFVAANGEVMATSETYTRRADAYRAVARFREIVHAAIAVDAPE